MAIRILLQIWPRLEPWLTASKAVKESASLLSPQLSPRLPIAMPKRKSTGVSQPGGSAQTSKASRDSGVSQPEASRDSSVSQPAVIEGSRIASKNGAMRIALRMESYCRVSNLTMRMVSLKRYSQRSTKHVKKPKIWILDSTSLIKALNMLIEIPA